MLFRSISSRDNTILEMATGFFNLNRLLMISNKHVSTTKGIVIITDSLVIIKESYFYNNSQFQLFENSVASELYFQNSFVDFFSITGTFPKMTEFFSNITRFNLNNSFECNFINLMNYRNQLKKDPFSYLNFQQGSLIKTSRYSRNTPGNFYLINSIFENLLFSGDGGAIFISGVLLNIIIEESFFFDCRISGQFGGAIFFFGDSIRLNKVCSVGSYSTHSTSYGQFSHKRAAVSNQMFINYTSVLSSNPTSTNSYYTLFLSFGNQFYFNNNLTHNNPGYYSIISSVNSFESLTKFCSFYHNYARIQSGIEFSKGLIRLIFCEIINNTHFTSNKPLIVNLNNAITYFLNCSFKFNSQILFNNQNKLTLAGCNFDHFQFTGSFCQTRNNNNQFQTFNLKNLNTIFCLGNSVENTNIDFDDFESNIISGRIVLAASENIRFNLESGFSIGDYFIKNSIFSNIYTSASYGGSIYISTSTSLTILSTIFFNCSTFANCGGAVFYSGSGYFLMKKICASHCFCQHATSTSYGQFLWSSVGSNHSNKIYESFIFFML